MIKSRYVSQIWLLAKSSRCKKFPMLSCQTFESLFIKSFPKYWAKNRGKWINQKKVKPRFVSLRCKKKISTRSWWKQERNPYYHLQIKEKKVELHRQFRLFNCFSDLFLMCGKCKYNSKVKLVKLLFLVGLKKSPSIWKGNKFVIKEKVFEMGKLTRSAHLIIATLYHLKTRHVSLCLFHKR